MKVFLDAYTRSARLRPALLVALPLGITTLAWFPDGLTGWSTLWGLIVWSGGTALLAQIGRDWGKKKQGGLFEAWGGVPTTCMLRHRDAPNKEILERRHRKLKELMPSLQIPTAEEEQANPSAADQIYENCTAFLREKTRDQKKFNLVFEENCNYGFRRNLWGMKPLGLLIAIAGLAAVIALFLLKGGSVPNLAIACGIINLLLLLGWIFWFTPKWVRIPAQAYAERLLESCENL